MVSPIKTRRGHDDVRKPATNSQESFSPPPTQTKHSRAQAAESCSCMIEKTSLWTEKSVTSSQRPVCPN
ncbi:hypothetical protein PGIGA_G00034900 [Pangasianodon gigas]|uniref:Uncharacterized protein n=1 Tax=Pangasianodon gigas TaxID=30993 RepID=A0ACC5WYU8_PANGG|nr:hypothetical protein [Pangasianodon gigas]